MFLAPYKNKRLAGEKVDDGGHREVGSPSNSLHGSYTQVRDRALSPCSS